MIESEHKNELLERIKEHVTLEVSGDIEALYRFTLPEIRDKRISERDDEPQLTKNSILSFTQKVRSAEILSIEIEKFHETAPLYSNCPAATVRTRVNYNNKQKPHESRTVWVLKNKTWYSTAINRAWG